MKCAKCGKELPDRNVVIKPVSYNQFILYCTFCEYGNFIVMREKDEV